MLLGAPLLCCCPSIEEKIEHCFDAIVCWVTGLKNRFQVNSLKFADKMVKITYEDLIWLLIQALVFSGTLDVPEL